VQQAVHEFLEMGGDVVKGVSEKSYQSDTFQIFTALTFLGVFS
jgi:hypothetical protein